MIDSFVVSARRRCVVVAAVMALFGMGCAARQAAKPAHPADCGTPLDLAPEEPVAEVEGEAITYGTLSKAAGNELARSRAESRATAYEILEKNLEALIDERLLRAAAVAERLTPEQLLQREVKNAVAEPTDDEIRVVFEDSRAKYGGLLPSFEESQVDIRRALRKEREETARRELFERLRAAAQIKFLLPPFIPAAVDVPVDGPSLGDPDAPVTMVEFADFECPFCNKVQATVRLILERYGDRVRFVFRDFPLSYHRFAAKAAEAAHCAADQGRYWEMHELLFENADALRIEDLKAYAVELGLDSNRFDACLDSSEKAALVKESAEWGKRLRIRGSPSFFINGRMITGAQPFARFQEIIEAELSAASP
jgi:protein-disulfide isomerase